MAMRTTFKEALPEEAAELIAVHRLTVGSTIIPPHNERVPLLELKRAWLEQAGFPPDALLDIQVRDGCLIITPERRGGTRLGESKSVSITATAGLIPP